MVRPGSSVVDPLADEDPRYLQQNISVRIVQMVPGDDVGEMCILGAHHPELQGVSDYTQSNTTSSGKGLLQGEEVVLDTLASLSPDDGVFMGGRSKGGVDAVLDDQMGYVCWRDYQFEAQLTAERTFPGAINFKKSGSNLTWTNPAGRYDLFKMILRSSGTSTPPATHTAGDDVTISGGNLGTSATSSASSFSLFAVYDDYHDTPEDIKDVSEGVIPDMT